MPSAVTSNVSSRRSIPFGIRESHETIDDIACTNGQSHNALMEFALSMIAKKFPSAALIDGQWITSNRTFSVYDPATVATSAPEPRRQGCDPRHRRREPRAARLV